MVAGVGNIANPTTPTAIALMDLRPIEFICVFLEVAGGKVPLYEAIGTIK